MATTVRTIATIDNSPLFDITKSVTTNTRQSFNAAVADGTTALPVLGIAFPLDDLLSVLITTDQAITLHTNATDGSGGQTLAIAAGATVSWQPGGIVVNPFTVAVTALYVTNASGFVANVKIVFDVDSD